MAPTVLPYNSQDFPLIPRQDYSNIPIQQKGLHSTGFDFMRLSYEKEGLISNYQRMINDHANLPEVKQSLGELAHYQIVRAGIEAVAAIWVAASA